MKIFEIGTGYTPIPAQIGAATEIVVQELTGALRKLGEEIHIIDIASISRADSDLPILEVPVPKCFSGTDVQLGLKHKLKRVVYSASLAGVLRRLLKETEETVVLHFHNQYNLFFFLKLVPKTLREKAFVAYTNHSHIWHSPWEEIEEKVRRRYFQEVYAMEHADRVFVLNEQTKRTVAEHLTVDPSRVKLVANGVNTDTYYPMTGEEKLRVKEQWGLAGKRIFIQAGSVCQRKNQLTALGLLLPLMREDKDLIFCYAGGIIDADYHRALRAFAAEQGMEDRVIYAGELKPGQELNRFYNLAEAMLFPSRAEGFSLVILEAMSAGTPVLIGENLRFSLAEHCLPFTQENFGAVVREQIFQKEKQEALSRKARQVVARNFSWDAIAREYAASWQTGIQDMQ